MPATLARRLTRAYAARKTTVYGQTEYGCPWENHLTRGPGLDPRTSTLASSLSALRRRIWIVVLVAAVATVAAYVFTARQPKVYVSSADVLLSQNAALELWPEPEPEQLGYFEVPRDPGANRDLSGRGRDRREGRDTGKPEPGRGRGESVRHFERRYECHHFQSFRGRS